MKLLVELSEKNEDIYKEVDGVIVALKGLAIESDVYYTIKEIENIVSKYPKLEVFVKINKNIFNKDLEILKEALIKLDKLNIKGILFYDIAILQLKKDLKLNVELVWNQTHMVNNYETCNYYYEHGVKYAILGKEITLDEIIEIVKNAKTQTIVEVVGIPSVAFSKRKLLSNYYSDLHKSAKNKIVIEEKITKDHYEVIEDDNGTSFYLDKVVNATGIIRTLYLNETEYILMREKGLEKVFYELVVDTKKYIDNKCEDNTYVDKYKMLGEFTNFFFKKTIYRVKKNEKN